MIGLFYEQWRRSATRFLLNFPLYFNLLAADAEQHIITPEPGLNNAKSPAGDEVCLRHPAGLKFDKTLSRLGLSGQSPEPESTAFNFGAAFLLRPTLQMIAAASRITTIQPPTPRFWYATRIGAAINETILTTLIIGFNAGPAVSLSGSPTVSPTTLALCRSEPLPVFLARSRGSSSIAFLALSQAPPPLAINTASS